MAGKNRTTPAGTHTAAVVGSLLLILAAVAAGMHPAGGGAVLAIATDIGITHRAPLTLSFTISRGKEPTLFEASQSGIETIFLDVPAEWTLREVRKGTLGQVRSKVLETGAHRWTLPTGIVASFFTPPIGTLRILRHSSGSLLLKLARVDLLTGKSTQESILINDPVVTLP